jgi:serine/threonine protein kinase
MIFLKKLGEGGFARIFKVRHKPTNSIRVAKIVKLYSKTDLRIFNNEVDIMTRLDSPYVNRIISYYIDDTSLFEGRNRDIPTAILVTHYIPGIDLLDYVNDLISKKAAFSYSQSWSVAYEMIRAVAFVNQSGFVHRDIKPENFVLVKSEGTSQKLKLIDFGLASPIGSPHLIAETGGTTFYMAPETSGQRNYTEKCDSWSIGVILAMLASGGTAVVGRVTSLGPTNKRIVSEEAIRIEIENLRKKGVHNELVSLISDLMNYIPSERLSAIQCLRRFPRSEVDPRDVESIVYKLCAIRDAPPFARLMRSLVAHMTEDAKVAEAERLFRLIDKAGPGKLSRSGLATLTDWDQSNLYDIIRSSPFDEITYNEFLSAFIDIRSDYSLNILWYIFDKLAGAEGVIDSKSLGEYLRPSGVQDVDSLINSCSDAIGDAVVSHLDFDSFMRCVNSID